MKAIGRFSGIPVDRCSHIILVATALHIWYNMYMLAFEIAVLKVNKL